MSTRPCTRMNLAPKMSRTSRCESSMCMFILSVCLHVCLCEWAWSVCRRPRHVTPRRPPVVSYVWPTLQSASTTRRVNRVLWKSRCPHLFVHANAATPSRCRVIDTMDRVSFPALTLVTMCVNSVAWPSVGCRPLTASMRPLLFHRGCLVPLFTDNSK
jgi:hypothetical protein